MLQYIDRNSRTLPPATKLWQGNIFTSVCQEFCPLGGHAWQGGMHGGGMPGGGVHGRGHAWQGGVCSGGTCMAGGVRGRKNDNCSGRYASYWNAFLFGVSSESQLPNVGLGDNKRSHNLPCRFRLVEWIKGHFNL